MKNLLGKMTGSISLTLCLMGMYAMNVQAQKTSRDDSLVASTSSTAINITNKFAPQPSSKVRLNFENWDHFLSGIVLNMGPAVRKRAPRVVGTGTRIITRDDSLYRFEGNKILYTHMGRAEKDWLKTYVSDLEELSTQTDITTLSMNDQLSYWYNLHNAAVISLIAPKYPLKTPEKLKPLKNSSETLHDAKILNVSGVPLSLRDIREKIVYPNWKNPLVIYGFHHGHLGGPSIAHRAYEHDRLHDMLNLNAAEFVNSFRGYRVGKIALLYKMATPFYFPNGESDIRAHLKRYMRPEVYKLVESYDALDWHKPLSQTADASGGVGLGTSSAPVTFVGRGGTSVSAAFGELLAARRERIRLARKRGYFTHSVTIEDIETSDTDLAKPVN